MTNTAAALGAALLNGQLVKIMCTDIRVGDQMQDEVTGEFYPVVKVNKSSYVIDARDAEYDTEPLPVVMRHRPGHYVMGVKAV